MATTGQLFRTDIKVAIDDSRFPEITAELRAKYGDGPFLVVAVHEIWAICNCGARGQLWLAHHEQCPVRRGTGVGHPQQVTVLVGANEQTMSGALLKDA